MKRRLEPFLAAAVLLLTACGEDPEPKPRGYFRIDLPEQAYVTWNSGIGPSAEVPAYAQMTQRPAQGEAKWFNLRFPHQRATTHLTWSPVKPGEIGALIEDAHAFKNTHGVKATRITSERMLRDSSRVFGTLFTVEGDVASPFVFYLTDSTANFLYGTLYFDTPPNADSLAPVTERLRADLRHFAATLRWK